MNAVERLETLRLQLGFLAEVLNDASLEPWERREYETLQAETEEAAGRLKSHIAQYPEIFGFQFLVSHVVTPEADPDLPVPVGEPVVVYAASRRQAAARLLAQGTPTGADPLQAYVVTLDTDEPSAFEVFEDDTPGP